MSYITQNGAGAFDGSDWDNAYRESDRATWLAAAGPHYFKGDFTAAGNWYSSVNGFRAIGCRPGTTATPPTSFTDFATGSDRPTVTLGASYTAGVSNYAQWANFNFTGSNTGRVVYLTLLSTLYNCVVNNTGGSDCLDIVSGQCAVIGCEIYGATGTNYAINAGNSASNKFVGNLIRDNTRGISAGTDTYLVQNILARNSVYGALFAGDPDCLIVGNILDDNGQALQCSNLAVIINNIFSNNTTAFNDEGTNYYMDGNNWYNNTADLTNGTKINVFNTTGKGPHALALNPQYADAANNDFTIGNASLKGLGFPSIAFDEMMAGNGFNHDLGPLQAR